MQTRLERSGNAECQISVTGVIVGYAVDDSVKDQFIDDDPTGKNIAETMSKDETSVFLHCIRLTLETGLDHYLSHRYVTANGSGFRQVRLSKPKKSNGGIVNAFVSII